MGFSIELIDGIVQANNNTFKLARAKDIDFSQATTATTLAAGDLFIFSDINADVSSATNADVKKITAANFKAYVLGANSINSDQYVDGSIDHVHLAADAVDGDNIADDSINSEHYVDGSIDTAHIADDQVTLAKMAGITQGSIIHGDNSGDPAYLTKGTASQVLRIDTSGNNLEWGAIGFSSGFSVNATNNDDTFYPIIVDGTSSNKNAKVDSDFTYNPSTGLLTTTSFAGDLTGDVTGNADTATKVYVTDNEGTGENNLIAFIADAATGNGNHSLEMDGDFHYRPGTGTLTATKFAGDLTGDVTGNADTVTTIPSLSGEVSNSGNSVTIADNIIDEANLKVSNAPTNGYVLTAQSGDTGGLTWAEAAGGVSGDSFATDLKIGRDAHNHIDFSADNKIVFKVDNTDRVIEIDGDSGTDNITFLYDLELESSSAGSDASVLKFNHDSASPATNDYLGSIQFFGDDAGGSSVKFGEIRNTVVATSATDYAGSLYFDVAKDGNTTHSGLAVKGRFAESVVDIDLGYGATSLTTIAGTLTMGSTAALNNSGLIQVAGQTNITSLGTLTNLDVDDINLNASTITITGDTGDTFTMVTGAAGATTLTTTDAGGAAGNFEVAADGTITLDAAGDIYLEPATNVHVAARGFNINSSASASPALSITNEGDDTTGPQVVLKNLRDGNGLEDGDSLGQINFSGDDAAGNVEGYATIEGSVVEADHGDEAGQLSISVANNGTLRNGITITAAPATDEEVNVSIGNTATSITTITGALTVGSTSVITNSGGWDGAVIPNTKLDTDTAHLSGTQTFSGTKTFSNTIVGSINGNAATATTLQTARNINGVSFNGSAAINLPIQHTTATVKILPSDFIPDDGGRPVMMDDGTSGKIHLETHGTLTAYASIAIPHNYKATHVTIYGTGGAAVNAYEAEIDSIAISSSVGSGTVGGGDITLSSEVASTQTNYLLVKVEQGSGDKIYGGKVTIAAV